MEVLYGLIFSSNLHFIKFLFCALGECSGTLTTIGISVAFMFPSFFSSLARSSYLSSFLLFFTQWYARIIIIIIIISMFLTLASADGLSLESKRQQVFSDLQNSSQHYSWPLQCCSLDAYHIYPTPPLGQDMTQGQFLSAV